MNKKIIALLVLGVFLFSVAGGVADAALSDAFGNVLGGIEDFFGGGYKTNEKALAFFLVFFLFFAAFMMGAKQAFGEITRPTAVFCLAAALLGAAILVVTNNFSLGRFGYIAFGILFLMVTTVIYTMLTRLGMENHKMWAVLLAAMIAAFLFFIVPLAFGSAGPLQGGDLFSWMNGLFAGGGKAAAGAQPFRAGEFTPPPGIVPVETEEPFDMGDNWWLLPILLILAAGGLWPHHKKAPTAGAVDPTNPTGVILEKKRMAIQGISRIIRGHGTGKKRFLGKNALIKDMKQIATSTPHDKPKGINLDQPEDQLPYLVRPRTVIVNVYRKLRRKKLYDVVWHLWKDYRLWHQLNEAEKQTIEHIRAFEEYFLNNIDDAEFGLDDAAKEALRPVVQEVLHLCAQTTSLLTQQETHVTEEDTALIESKENFERRKNVAWVNARQSGVQTLSDSFLKRERGIVAADCEFGLLSKIHKKLKWQIRLLGGGLTITPSAGPAAGGDAVVITGPKLEFVNALTIGGNELVGRNFDAAANQITGATPPGDPGPAAVKATYAGGGELVLENGYTYEDIPMYKIHGRVLNADTVNFPGPQREYVEGATVWVESRDTAGEHIGTDTTSNESGWFLIENVPGGSTNIVIKASHDEAQAEGDNTQEGGDPARAIDLVEGDVLNTQVPVTMNYVTLRGKVVRRPAGAGPVPPVPPPPVTPVTPVIAVPPGTPVVASDQVVASDPTTTTPVPVPPHPNVPATDPVPPLVADGDEDQGNPWDFQSGPLNATSGGGGPLTLDAEANPTGDPDNTIIAPGEALQSGGGARSIPVRPHKQQAAPETGAGGGVPTGPPEPRSISNLNDLGEDDNDILSQALLLVDDKKIKVFQRYAKGSAVGDIIDSLIDKQRQSTIDGIGEEELELIEPANVHDELMSIINDLLQHKGKA